jgi:hypothetical protein
MSDTKVGADAQPATRERSPGDLDSPYYRLTDGSLARYPGGRTRREWEDRIGTPSFEHAHRGGYAEG